MDTSFRLLPEQASRMAGQVDLLYFYLIGVAIFFTVLIATLIIFYAIKYRRSSSVKRTATHANPAVELLWVGPPSILLLVMFFWGARLFFIQASPPDNALQIDVVARQWMWKFQHPEGHREINDLHIPLNTPVRLSMISEDVIHSLYVPAFRIKQDVLPGRYSHEWFEATRPGEYHLFCAEYCGAKHSAMIGRLVVMELSDYEAWLSGSASQVPPAEAGRILFEQMRCDTCHRGGGETGRGPALQNLFGARVPLQNGGNVIADEAYLRESILRPAAKLVAGYQPIMPTFQGQIGEEGLIQLIAYIKSLSTQAPPAAGEQQP